MFAPRPNHLVAARAFKLDCPARFRRHDRPWNPDLCLAMRATLFGTGRFGRSLNRRLAARTKKLDRSAGNQQWRRRELLGGGHPHFGLAMGTPLLGSSVLVRNMKLGLTTGAMEFDGHD